MHRKLTFATVSKLSTPGRYFDGGNCLHLFIKPNGSRYYIFRYQLNGRRRDMGLGNANRISLSAARKKALDAQIALDAGHDPIVLRRASADKKIDKLEFSIFAKEFIELKQKEWVGKHAKQWASTLEKHVYLKIGNKLIDEVDTNDILNILKPIWLTKTETASRIRGRLEKILAAATVRGFRSGANPAAWRGHLEMLLPAPQKLKRVVHHAALPYRELPDFLAKLRRKKTIVSLALEFTILTAARTGEAIYSRFSEVNSQVWTIPAERMKARRPHRVPLGARSLEILTEAKKISGSSDYIFAKNGKPISNMAMLTLIKRAGLTSTVHGFRSSFRDWVAESTTFSGDVAEMALAHSIPNKVEAAYRRGDLLKIRMNLMVEWEKFCRGTQIELT